MAHPYQRVIFDLREFSKIQSEFKDSFEHCFEDFVEIIF